jgi:hypothetical protein
MVQPEPTPEASPLNAQQLATLAETRRLHKKLRVARGVALFNVIGLGFFGVFSFIIAVFTSSFPWAGIALCALAYGEERGRRGLIAADDRAPRWLAYNQLAMLGIILVYCAVNMYFAYRNPDVFSMLEKYDPEFPDVIRQIDPDDAGAWSHMGGWMRWAALMGYGAVALGSVVVQGLTAAYYYSLRGTVEALAKAPAWARALV